MKVRELNIDKERRLSDHVKKVAPKGEFWCKDLSEARQPTHLSQL